jgi:RimJ/RimL family protein N-acetyltransferase
MKLFIIKGDKLKTPNGETDPIIRRANRKDAQQIVAGINAICAEGGSFYTTQFILTPQWEAVLYHPEKVPDHLLAVAEWNGQIVGAGRLFPGGENTLMNHVTELGLFVLSPFRGRGVGTRLFTQLRDWATHGGVEKIALSVSATNKPAIRFYQKQGFSQEGRLSRHIKINESYVDLLLMGLFL